MPASTIVPLTLLVEAITPRIRYTLDTCLREILGFEYVLLLPGAPRPDPALPLLNYTRQAIAGTWPLACNGLLYEEGLREEPIAFGLEMPLSDREPLWKTDHFAYIFYRLTEYDHCAHPVRDAHGRYRDAILEPSVEQGLEYLESKLAPLYDSHNPPRQERKFDFEITIDVDHPWKFRHKGLVVHVGGMFKDVADRRMSTFWERLRSFRNGTDPYDGVEEQINRICPPEKTTVFFLVDGKHKLDSRFSLRMEAYRDMVSRYQAAGFGIGLHPSYETWQDQEKISAEKKLLEEVAGPVTRSRQHYLRYQLPETFRYLWEAGIRDEYTICPVGGSGAKTGILRSYLWFDLERNEVSPLRLHPAVVMDRNLQQYLGLGPEKAAEEIKKWISEVRSRKGKFIMILHNETFSESGEWKGWLPVIEAIVAELTRHES